MGGLFARPWSIRLFPHKIMSLGHCSIGDYRHKDLFQLPSVALLASSLLASSLIQSSIRAAVSPTSFAYVSLMANMLVCATTSSMSSMNTRIHVGSLRPVVGSILGRAQNLRSRLFLVVSGRDEEDDGWLNAS